MILYKSIFSDAKAKNINSYPEVKRYQKGHALFIA